MNTVARVLLLAFLLLFAGCRKDGQVSKEQPPEKEAPSIITIEDLATTERDLTLDYRVANPFAYDIWICEDIDTKGKCDVETRIELETVLMKLKFKLCSNIFRNPLAIGEYLRLAPGDSHSGRIILELPVRNASPVYVFHEDGKSRKQVMLHRLVLEVGYFEGWVMDEVAEGIEKIKRDPNFRATEIEPVIVEETQAGQLRRLLRPNHIWPGLAWEKSAKAVMTDVNIACSVVVDDKQGAERRVRNLLHTRIQSVYCTPTLSAWAKTKFAHPTRANKTYVLRRSPSAGAQDKLHDEAISTPGIRDCFASLAMTYTAMLSNDFAIAPDHPRSGAGIAQAEVEEGRIDVVAGESAEENVFLREGRCFTICADGVLVGNKAVFRSRL